jgi:hypothetical protein
VNDFCTEWSESTVNLLLQESASYYGFQTIRIALSRSRSLQFSEMFWIITEEKPKHNTLSHPVSLALNFFFLGAKNASRSEALAGS